MRMVSHPGLIFFLWMVSHPGYGTKIMRGKRMGTNTIHNKFTCRYSSTWCHDDPGHGTKIMTGKRMGTNTIHDKFTCRYSSTWCHDDPGHGTKIMRGKRMGTNTIHDKFTSEFLKSSRIAKSGATRCHSTRGCQRCPSTSLYELLSLNLLIVYSPVSY